MQLVQIESPRPRLPEWARRPGRFHESLHGVKTELRRLGLHTVCEAARCPNIHECFHRGTATFMILGDVCTRTCGFCAVPRGRPLEVDPTEPVHIASMAARMHLRHVVITSVNRDELPDGGAGHFARTVTEVRQALPAARVEVLTPDFRGDLAAVATVLAAGPDIFNHNMETVGRLYRRVRPQAEYERSLDVLAFAKRQEPQTLTKSGFMVGLGERPAEVETLLSDLHAASVDVVTIGQYLQPTRHHLPVEEYLAPERFEAYREYGLRLGFRAVFSGPLVRSSYMADLVAEAAG